MIATSWKITLVTQPFEKPDDGTIHEYTQVQYPDWGITVPMTGPDTLLLVHEFWQGVEQLGYSFPTGLEKFGETSTDAAHRELEEETGYRAGTIRPIGRAWSNPRSSPSIVHIFAATECTATGKRALDDGEDIEVVEVTVKEFWDLTKRGAVGSLSAHGAALYAVAAGVLPPP